MDEKPVCSFCTRARVVIICAIIAAVVAFRPEFDAIKRYDLLGVFAWLITIFITVIFSWRAYNEFWKRR
tara:strand:+ start:364 stop:570 length:207 start_codon:yes stop_codon:yes gene_type:complete